MTMKYLLAGLVLAFAINVKAQDYQFYDSLGRYQGHSQQGGIRGIPGIPGIPGVPGRKCRLKLRQSGWHVARSGKPT
jgi:hypothetical protein